MNLRHAIAVALLIIGISHLAGSNADAQTAKQREAIAKVQTSMAQAGKLFSDKKFKECAELIKSIQIDVESLVATRNNRIISALRPTYKRLEKAHALMELEGYTLPKLKSLTPAKPDPKSQGVSFSKSVVPVLVKNCGGCHVTRARGRFSMATYPQLMAGPNNNRVIFPGDAVGSRLVEVIEDGEMPPNNANFKAEDLGIIKKWIAEGAKFDGKDQAERLDAIARAADPNAPTTPEAKVVKATGKETVSFALDIAPLFINNCNGCHFDVQNNARGGLNVSTFRQIIRGGDTGAIIVQGKPEESLLVKRLKGEGGTRMPAGRPPLKDEDIAKIEKWIKEGGKFDAQDDRENIRPIYELAKATKSTHEELMSERLASSEKNWKLFMPSTKANKVETDNFVVIGDMSGSVLEDYAKLAEKTVPQLKRTFMGKSGPLVKGRVTLYLFKQRYDYSEFGKMVEKRDIPKGLKGHFRFDVINAYGAIILPRNKDEFSDKVMFTQQIAGVLVASLGKNTPMWFAEGAARAAAQKVDAKDPRIQEWQSQIPQIAAKMQSGDEFVKGQLPPEDTAIAGYIFVGNLMKNRSQFNKLIRALREGNDFEKAFSIIYGGTPAEVLNPGARRNRSRAK